MKERHGEFCIIKSGAVSDATMHDPILDNPEADAAISSEAVERAIRDGMTREQAERLYG